MPQTPTDSASSATLVAGREAWVIGHRRDGRPIYAIAGGDGAAGDPPAAGGGTPPPAEPPAVGATPPAPPSTPAAAGATPPAPPPAQPPGDDAERRGGEAGLRADLARERDRRQEAERQLQALQAQSQTDAERALEAARKEAGEERDSFWRDHIRRVEIRSQLRAAGIASDKVLELAAQAPAFGELKVTDTGEVEGLGPAVEQFKKDYPEMFGQAAAGGWDGAEGGSGPRRSGSLEEAVAGRIEQTSRR